MFSPAAFMPEKILVCQLRQIGDVILATPSVELLKRKYPASAISFLTEKKCAPVLQKNPCIESLISLDKESFGSVLEELRWYWHVARKGFDLVVDFQQLPRCRWVVAFSGAQVRLSFTPPWYNRLLYTHFTAQVDGYAAMAKAQVLSPLGIQYTNERPKIYLSDQERADARQFLQSLGLQPEHRLMTVHAVHRRNTRRWAPAFYAETMRMLAEKDQHWRFLLLCAPDEIQEIQKLAAMCSHISEHLLVPSRKLSLRETAACIAEAALHLGNCSAPRHIAVAVGTPSCIIRGASSEDWTYPSSEHITVAANLPCQPCNYLSACPNNLQCLADVHPDQVVQAVCDLATKVQPSQR